jgi:Fic family protein
VVREDVRTKAVGLLRPSDLAGYRAGQVFIRKSVHVPFNREAMPALFDLLREEEYPAVRVVLGHFVFLYIHPHMDGNGRMGRFLMNVMVAAGGYLWTVIPLSERNTYMAALWKRPGLISDDPEWAATRLRCRLSRWDQTRAA